MNIKVGSTVKVRGESYRVVAIHNLSKLGSKGFGRFGFLLRAADGCCFQAVGKKVAHNSALLPANPVLWPGYVTKENTK